MTFVEFLKSDLGKLAVHPCIAVPCIECGIDFNSFQELEKFRLSYPQTARDRDRPTEEVYWVRLTGSIDLDVRRAVGLETTRSAWDKYEVYLDRLAKYGPMLMPPEVKLCQLDPKDFQRRHR